VTATHDDIATTWRDLADQLTPEQVQRLTDWEGENIPPAISDARQRQGYLNVARMMIERNLRQALCADVPLPADMLDELGVSLWEDWDGQRSARMYAVAKLPVAGTNVTVHVVGWQFDDGSSPASVDSAVACTPRRTRLLTRAQTPRRTCSGESTIRRRTATSCETSGQTSRPRSRSMTSPTVCWPATSQMARFYVRKRLPR